MKNTPLALNRIITACVSALRIPYYPSKTGISRFCSGFLIFALLFQMLISGPIRRVKAGSNSLPSMPLSAPPAPFHFQNSLSDVIEPSALRTSLLSELPKFLSWPNASESFAENTTLDPMKNFAIGDTSPLSVADSEPKTAELKPKENELEPKEVVANPNINALSMMTAAGTVSFDFDGDGKADVGRWHPSTHEFKVRGSADKSYFSTQSLGNGSSKPAPGDFDGDGKTDAAVFSPGTTSTTGTWSYLPSHLTNPTPQTISLSGVTGDSSGDIPVAGDFDHDGISDVGIFRNGYWYIRESSTGATASPVQWGAAGFTPITGDYDGDGATDYVVYRLEISNNDPPYEYHIHWYFHLSSGGETDFWWGQAGDVPVEGDFDGDSHHRSDLAVYRPSEGTWYVATSDGGTWIPSPPVGWGNYGDQPVPADYNGDGITDFAVWRPKSGVWFIRKSNLDNPEKPAYAYATLGMAGDTAIPSSYIKQVGATINGYDFANARLAPANATGGTNLYSRNFSWGTSLVGLPGRSGLDAGFGISYNSLVWLKHDSTMYFDPDFSNVSPGFRFGFPSIEQVYYNKKYDFWAYMMVTPDGSRKEFRQIAASNQYETADSSYAQLVTTGAASPNDPVENITIKVTSTDGTQMFYDWRGGAFHCNKVLDRNGNFLLVNHDDQGLLKSVTDTLGRVINVSYDVDLYPSGITQTWKNENGSGSNVTHSWASFSYATVTVTTNFGNGVSAVSGPPNDSILKVLEKVNYADGSYTKFLYNSYAQVKKIENYAADGHKLNHVRTDLDSVNGVQTDCPRFTETDSYAENFNGGQEVSVLNSAPYASSFSGGHVEEQNTMAVDVRTVDHPNELYSILHFAGYDENAKWKEGLPVATEDCTGEYHSPGSGCSNRQRWSWTKWEQDQVGMNPYNYLLNPRVVETQIGDNSNTKRSTMSYIQESSQDCSTSPIGGDLPESGTNVACFGLVDEVDVYGVDLETPIKKSVSRYNLGVGSGTATNPTYKSLRIIGLPSQVETWGRDDATQSLEYVSKVTYGYDESGYTNSDQLVVLSAGHDNTAYGANFLLRGNLTSTTRWDATNSTTAANPNLAVTSRVKYNTAGSPISQTSPTTPSSPVGRTTKISYVDTFNSGGIPATYAYPTRISDSAATSFGDFAHTSILWYRYDTGANVAAIGPAPSGNTYGKTASRLFDSLGRPERDWIYVGDTPKSYTRYEYPTNGIQSKVYSTIVDFNNSGGPDAADEVLSESWSDGAGRVRGSRTEHPGSSGGWRASLTEYDILGRTSRQSVPTEVSVVSPNDPAHWTPAGDDYRGTNVWLWTSHKYDWKGRVIRKINTDGDPELSSNDSDVFISYEGCGCAGGQVTTIQGENIIETDWQGNNQTTLGRRTQRIHEDILGRAYQTEVMNWDGSTVYSSTVNTYNGRDQITNTRQYAGDTNSSTYRDVTVHYDGHGRMKDRHYPIEDTNAKTIWSYNADDSINTVIDPRGVTTTFGYYPTTGLLHTIGYDVPSGLTNVADTPDVSYTYDNLGNKIVMTDGTGSASYSYNSLSQMTSETKSISGLTDSFTINYTYNLSGGLKTISDPHNPDRKVVYNHDKTGRVTGASMSLQGTTTEWVHDVYYRAWGDLKGLEFNQENSSYENAMNFGYDNRLQINGYLTQWNGQDTQTLSFQHYSDGNLKTSATNELPTGDRVYKYDHTGRLTKGYSGKDAHDGDPNVVAGPYKQELTYNRFSETTAIVGKSWGVPNTAYSKSYTGLTGREANTGYDSAGNIVTDRIETIPTTINRTMKYDAAGRQVETFDPIVHACCENEHTYTNSFDGNGWKVKGVDLSVPPSGPTTTSITYEIRSTVLGGEKVGERFPNTEYPQDNFVAPLLGGELKYTNIVGVSETTTYTRKPPEGFAYDTLGSEVSEDPVQGGGSYPAGGADPTTYTRCVEGGTPVPCDTQSRFDKAWNDMVAAYNKKLKDAADAAKGQASQHESSHKAGEHKDSAQGGHQTSQTNKPAPDPETPGSVSQASLPCVDGEDENGVIHVCTSEKGPHFDTLNGSNAGVGMATLGGDCDLVVPSFDQLGTANYGGTSTLALLNNTFGKGARLEYANLKPETKAVLLNTVEAAAAQGVSFATARFVEFYNGHSGTANAYGVTVSGITPRNLDDADLKERSFDGIDFGRRPDPSIKEGSVEATVENNGDVSFDVDLNNPYSLAILAHAGEVGRNHRDKKTTDPVDAMRRLNRRGVFTGVRCIPRSK